MALRRHEPLGCEYRWPPTAGDVNEASKSDLPHAYLMHLLCVDVNGVRIWESFEDFCAEVDPQTVEHWARVSGTDAHLSEPEDTDEDWERLHKAASRVPGAMGIVSPLAGAEIRDRKAYDRLTPYERMAVDLAVHLKINPGDLLLLDYVVLRGLLAKVNLDGREAERRAQRRQGPQFMGEG